METKDPSPAVDVAFASQPFAEIKIPEKGITLTSVGLAIMVGTFIVLGILGEGPGMITQKKVLQ